LVTSAAESVKNSIGTSFRIAERPGGLADFSPAVTRHRGSQIKKTALLVLAFLAFQATLAGEQPCEIRLGGELRVRTFATLE
jgi:hypothetical protein